MAFIRLCAFSALLLCVLSVIVGSGARSAPATLRDLTQQELLDLPQHVNPISDEQDERIVAILGPEYLNTALEVLITSSPVQECPRCGKQTEFIDWIYTAVERGIHSPEFIVESLKLRHGPNKFAHDVYCSRCGALTAFTDHTGEEGNAPHIDLAPPYDRATKTFAPSQYVKRDERVPQAVRETTLEEHSVAVDEAGKTEGEAATPPPAFYHPRLWAKAPHKREAGGHENFAVDESGTTEDEAATPPPAFYHPRLWAKAPHKRVADGHENVAVDESGTTEDEAATPPPAFYHPRLWAKAPHKRAERRDNADSSEEGANDDAPEPVKDAASPLIGCHPLWDTAPRKAVRREATAGDVAAASSVPAIENAAAPLIGCHPLWDTAPRKQVQREVSPENASDGANASASPKDAEAADRAATPLDGAAP